MKVVTCEIAWHNKEPVYSLDFQHSADGRVRRLATAGVDTTVRVSVTKGWKLMVMLAQRSMCRTGNEPSPHMFQQSEFNKLVFFRGTRSRFKECALNDFSP